MTRDGRMFLQVKRFTSPGKQKIRGLKLANSYHYSPQTKVALYMLSFAGYSKIHTSIFFLFTRMK